MKALAGNKEIWALNLELRLYQYRNPDVQERGRKAPTEPGVGRLVHGALLGRTGHRPEVPVETISAILLNVSDGFVQAARVDADTEDLFATFLDLFIPAVMEDPQTREDRGSD